MKKNRQPQPKGFSSLVILILGLGIVTLLGLTYLKLSSPSTTGEISQTSSVAKPSATPSPSEVPAVSADEYAGWQTIEDKELGLSFKIPPKWVDHGAVKGDSFLGHYVGSSAVRLLYKRDDSDQGVRVEKLYKVSYPKFKDKSPYEYYTYIGEQPKGVWRLGVEHLSYQMMRGDDLTVAGYPAIVQVEKTVPDAQTEPVFSYSVYFVRDSDVYQAVTWVRSEEVWDEHKKEFEPTFKKILNSIRFLK